MFHLFVFLPFSFPFSVKGSLFPPLNCIDVNPPLQSGHVFLKQLHHFNVSITLNIVNKMDFSILFKRILNCEKLIYQIGLQISIWSYICRSNLLFLYSLFLNKMQHSYGASVFHFSSLTMSQIQSLFSFDMSVSNSQSPITGLQVLTHAIRSFIFFQYLYHYLFLSVFSTHTFKQQFSISFVYRPPIFLLPQPRNVSNRTLFPKTSA